MKKIEEVIIGKWDFIYKSQDYAFGTEPNVYFKSFLTNYKPSGKILLPAEGEGRNAVFAAGLGMDVFAFDISQEAKKKALRLAESKHVEIRYEIGDFLSMKLDPVGFNAAALIYAHFHPTIRSAYHRKIADFIKPEGWIVLEGFSEKNTNVMGQDLGTHCDLAKKFYTVEAIKNDFSDFDTYELMERNIELAEGLCHRGVASVVRYIGRKKLKCSERVQERIGAW